MAISSLKKITQTININSASLEELTSILQISEPLTQLPEITNLKWQEWEEQEIIITVK